MMKDLFPTGYEATEVTIATVLVLFLFLNKVDFLKI